MWPFKQKIETRSASYTDLAMQLRGDWISGRCGIADLTATVQGAASLWENGLSLAESSSSLLTPQVLAMIARGLAFRGESVWVIDEVLTPVAEFDLSTIDGHPKAYRVTVPDVGGGRSMTVLAAEVLHFRIGSNQETPWRGSSPLHRASLSAGVLNAVEAALADVFENAPLGSQIVAMPETGPGTNDQLASSFRGKRGRVLLRESTQVTAAGGAAPAQDWKPSDLTPDLSDSQITQTWARASASILHAFGVLPALLDPSTTGPLVREAQRHLCQWTLIPIATAIAAEASHKLAEGVTLDVEGPLNAYDAGGRARALKGIVDALAVAKQAGIDPGQVAEVAKFTGVEV